MAKVIFGFLFILAVMILVIILALTSIIISLSTVSLVNQTEAGMLPFFIIILICMSVLATILLNKANLKFKAELKGIKQRKE
jgi:hypothetical protein